MKRYFRATIGILAMAFVSMLSSCSNTDYVNAIPKQATAIISVDAAQMSGVGSLSFSKLCSRPQILAKQALTLAKRCISLKQPKATLAFVRLSTMPTFCQRLLPKQEAMWKRSVAIALLWLAEHGLLDIQMM